MPFTVAEMMESIPFTADSETAESVLNGEDIEGATLEATGVLNECRRKIRDDANEINVDEMRTGVKRWDERTSALSSGLHLGVYKCLTDPNKQKEEKEHPLEVVTEIVNITMERGTQEVVPCPQHSSGKGPQQSEAPQAEGNT